MGVPTSEVGYTPATPRRKDHEVHKDMWWYWTTTKVIIFTVFCDEAVGNLVNRL